MTDRSDWTDEDNPYFPTLTGPRHVRNRELVNLYCWFAVGLLACAVVLVSALNDETAGWFALPICSISIVRCWRADA